jgi:hypothetical protein
MESLPRRYCYLNLGTSGIKVRRAARSIYDYGRYYGINKVISQSKHKYLKIGHKDIRPGDILLISLTATTDILSIIRYRNLLSKAERLIIGGPACHNVKSFAFMIDAANFGRCDNNKIDRILDGETLDTVWTKSDPDFQKVYRVDDEITLEGEVQLPNCNVKYDELSVGCRKKCGFCLYSWWNGYKTSTGDSLKFTSNVEKEDFWETLDWNRGKISLITALDGFSEETRRKIFKPITKQNIIEKLLEADKSSETFLRVKIYLIAGYPWENQEDLEGLDLIDACRHVDQLLKRVRINIILQISHFIPFPKTPLWWVAFNDRVNARAWAGRAEKKYLFKGDRIVMYSGGPFAQHPATSAMACILMRAGVNDFPIVEMISSVKFQLTVANDKIKWMRDNAGHLLEEQKKEPVDYIRVPQEKKLQKIVAMKRLGNQFRPQREGVIK